MPLLRRLQEDCFAQLLICSGDAIWIDIKSKLFEFVDKAILLKLNEKMSRLPSFLCLPGILKPCYVHQSTGRTDCPRKSVLHIFVLGEICLEE